MIIRKLQEKDIPEVESIYDLYWSDRFKQNLSRKLKDYVANSQESIEQGFNYFVAEENNEVIGVAGFRRVKSHMIKYTTTKNPVEFYILAVKNKGKGIGSALRQKRIEEAKKLGYTEAIFFSSENHKDSWVFHDKSDFKQVGDTTAPNGEPGKIWRMVFK